MDFLLYNVLYMIKNINCFILTRNVCHYYIGR